MQLVSNNHITYTSNECGPGGMNHCLALCVNNEVFTKRGGAGVVHWHSLSVIKSCMWLGWDREREVKCVLSTWDRMLSHRAFISFTLAIWWTLHSYEAFTLPEICHQWKYFSCHPSITDKELRNRMVFQFQEECSLLIIRCCTLTCKQYQKKAIKKTLGSFN